jgi:hypothetical protein
MSMATKEHKQRVPNFKSDEEEAQFWDTHSPLDYPDSFKDEQSVRVERPLEHTLAVRLDAETIDKLSGIARRIGVGPSTLAHRWLMERLADFEDEERNRTAHQHSGSNPL